MVEEVFWRPCVICQRARQCPVPEKAAVTRNAEAVGGQVRDCRTRKELDRLSLVPAEVEDTGESERRR